jgi:aspartyl-tRNA(Asn)/glutamyl-tRNA(Gln) amidotransferase subunit B
VEELRAALPELPTARRRRLQAEWGLSDLDMQALLNAGALDSVVATVAAGVTADAARKWWLGELARRANEEGVEVSALPISPSDVAALVKLIEAGTLNDKLARQVIEGVLAGEGGPEEVVAARGLAVVSDSGALGTAVDEAIAGNAAIADKIRGGKVAAVGALVGAVMKATRGQADAATVKALILERLGVAE